MSCFRSFRIALAVIALAPFVALVFAGGAGPALFKIRKTEAADLSLFQRSDVTVVIDLGDCYLARGDAEGLGALAEGGYAAEVAALLDPGKDYYLFRYSRADEASGLKSWGGVVQIEGTVHLFAVGAGENPFRSLPKGARIRPLPSAPIAPPRPERAEAELRQPSAFLSNPAIISLVDGVSRDKIASTIQDLQDFGTRLAILPQCGQAGDYLYRQLGDTGFNGVYDPFPFDYESKIYEGKNVIATIPGAVTPEKQVILCGHYDSINGESDDSPAPGADDNASGTAAVVEAARVMSGYTFDSTLVFACFSAEEEGLYGSAHYATRAYNAGANIVGVFNMDMNAYGPPPSGGVEVICDARSEALADLYVGVLQQYVPGLKYLKTLDPREVNSDHSSFWEKSYKAVFLFELAKNPNYHTSGDTFSTLNLDINTAVAKSAVAAAASIANPLSRKGDYNLDWLLNEVDFRMLAGHQAGNQNLGPAADYNGDGFQNALDLALLKRAALN